MPWATLWHSNLCTRIRSLHPCLTVIFCCLFVRVNPRRGASGFCGLRPWTWNSYHHQRVAVNGHICSHGVDIVVMDLVQKTAMCAVLRSQGLEVQSILMDHILCRRSFAVPAGVDVFSFPIWNPIVFQSIVQEIPPFPPFPPRPSHDSPRKGRAGNPNCLFFLFLASEASTFLFQHSSFQKVILDELFGFSLLRCSSVFSSLVSDLKIYPSSWSCVHCGFAADYPQCRSPILETTMRGLVQLDFLKHWNESTDCKFEGAR